MTMDEAMKINDRLVQAWTIQHGFADGDIPPLDDISLKQAIEASRMVSEHPGTPLPGGGKTIHCHVEPTRVRQLFIWALSVRPRLQAVEDRP